MSAAHAVFATFELLEAVLIQLSPADLLLSAQQVSKQWNAIIHTSFRLKRKLFLEATTSKTIVYARKKVKVSATLFRMQSFWARSDEKDCGYQTSANVAINPFLDCIFPHCDSAGYDSRTIADISWFGEQPTNDPVLRRMFTPCLRMHLTSPPAQYVKMRFLSPYTTPGSPVTIRVKPRYGAGVLVQDIVDVLRTADSLEFALPDFGPVKPGH